MHRLCDLSLRFPRTVLVAALALSALLGAGLPRLSTDVGYRAFLGTEHPSVRGFDEFLERFGGGLPMLAVWSCDASPCESALDPGSLAMAAEIASELTASSAIRRVESPASAVLVQPTPLGPAPRTLLDVSGPAPDLAELARRATRDPTWVGRLVSADGRVGALVLELASSESDVAVEAYQALDAALAPWEDRGFEFHRVGGPVEFVVAGGELEAATARLMPVMVTLVGVILLVLLRSLACGAAILAVVGLAVLWTLGLLGWLSSFGWAQNSLTQALPPLVLVIGACDGIHLAARYASVGARSRPLSRSAREAVLRTVAHEIGAPCWMTSATTAAGFLSFLAADLESFVRFGALAAFGVMTALLLSFTLLPLLLRHVSPSPPPARRVSWAWDRTLTRLLEWTRRRARPVIVAALGVGVLAGAGMLRLQVDASFEELYGEDSRVVRWVRFVSERLRRPDTLEIELTLPEDAEVSAPESLGVIESVGTRLAESESLGQPRSLLVPLAWARRLSYGDDPGAQRPSDDADENAALLERIYELGGGRGSGSLAHWLSADGRHVRISLESDKTPQAELRIVMERVNRILEELPSGWVGKATGPLSLVHDMIESIRSTQLTSFLGAGIAVLVLVAAFLGSLRSAALAMVPTLLPVVTTLGLMGWLGVALDVGSAMVAAVVLGIAVDDAIHLLEQIRRGRREGLALSAAVERAVLRVGRALVTTSLALAAGFLALALSPWQSVASFGLISAIAISGALGATLVVLPALILGGAGRSH